MSLSLRSFAARFACALALTPPAVALATPAAEAPAAIEIAPGVHLIAGGFAPGFQPDGNTVVLDAPDGLVVVDTGRHAAHTAAILAYARERGRRIAAVVNTHWHLDHVGGNVRVREAHPDVRVWAGPGLREALTSFLAGYRRQLEGAIAGAADEETRRRYRAEVALIDAGAALGPDEVVTVPGARTIAGRRLELGFEPHTVTAGDVWVLDPASGVLIAGDLVTLPAPFLDTACPKRWRAALARLAGTPFTKLVPGHGRPMTPAQLGAYRRAFDALLDCAAGAEPGAACVDGWLRGTAALAPGEDPAFVRSLVTYYLDTHLRGDPAKTAEPCGE